MSTQTTPTAGSKRKRSSSKSSSKKSKKRKIEPRKEVVKVEKVVPEACLFTRLAKLEQHLDEVIRRKHIELQEAQRPVSSLRQTLRITVWNSYDNQQGHYHATDASMANVTEEPSWTLRIEGRIVDNPQAQQLQQQGVGTPTSAPSTPGAVAATPTPNPRKFTSYLKKMYVQLKENGESADSIEPFRAAHGWQWHRSQAVADTDGFEIKRKGSTTQEITIFIHLAYSPPRYKLSPPLADVLGIHTETRPRILVALWQYIKANRLQDADDRKRVNLDESLEKAFGQRTIEFTALPQYLHEHLSPPDPVKLTYTTVLSGDPIGSAKSVDVAVFDDSSRSEQKALNAKEFDELEAKIQEGVVQINQSRMVREFMMSLAEAPIESLNAVLASEARQAAVMNAAEKRELQMRTSDLYYQPLVDTAVNTYLNRLESGAPSTKAT